MQRILKCWLLMAIVLAFAGCDEMLEYDLARFKGHLEDLRNRAEYVAIGAEEYFVSPTVQKDKRSLPYVTEVVVAIKDTYARAKQKSDKTLKAVQNNLEYGAHIDPDETRAALLEIEGLVSLLEYNYFSLPTPPRPLAPPGEFDTYPVPCAGGAPGTVVPGCLTVGPQFARLLDRLLQVVPVMHGTFESWTAADKEKIRLEIASAFWRDWESAIRAAPSSRPVVPPATAVIPQAKAAPSGTPDD
jgi:hypothetical protein